jgi:hypothetical protein
VYLSASSQKCLDAFLSREQTTGRNLSRGHWEENNRLMFEFLGTEEAKQYAVPVFDDESRRRTLTEIEGDILQKPRGQKADG